MAAAASERLAEEAGASPLVMLIQRRCQSLRASSLLDVTRVLALRRSHSRCSLLHCFHAGIGRFILLSALLSYTLGTERFRVSVAGNRALPEGDLN